MPDGPFLQRSLALVRLGNLLKSAGGAVDAIVKVHHLDMGRTKIRVAETPAVPEGEIQFRDSKTGKILVRLINVGKGKPEDGR